MPANLESSAIAAGLEKLSFHSNPKEGQCPRVFRLPYNSLISHASKIMLKILQARLQQHVNQELSDVQNWVWKRQRNQRSNCQHPLDHSREGNGNPLQYYCLENPRDGGAWWAAVYGVTQSQTRLKQLSSSSSNWIIEKASEYSPPKK